MTPYLFIIRVFRLLKANVSADSCFPFNTTWSSANGYSGNVWYNRFISLQYALHISLHNLYHGTYSMDQEHLYRQTCCVRTSRLCMCVYLFCIWCFTISLILHLIHPLIFQFSDFNYFFSSEDILTLTWLLSLQNIYCLPLADAVRKLFQTFMQKWYASLWVAFKDISSFDKVLIAIECQFFRLIS